MCIFMAYEAVPEDYGPSFPPTNNKGFYKLHWDHNGID